MNSSNGGMMGFSKSSAAAAAATAAAAGSASSSPFTVSQWQELEHQALIFKYMVAGLPVPPDLVLPIQTTAFHSNNFFHHPIPTFVFFD
ncbi:growth-regulating factor 5-like protein [Trifolium pratense]|uniref:Growth-regulating factor n=1 Tax=Trifolium pratense TaxID=57577 RepID=A0A2K3K5I6_TRIPR|nr:growth-regulating factor 5-like protein [Trifolium pratense]